jgi:enamine deaminase RidA (YjgF/YER057c/UK114 family)
MRALFTIFSLLLMTQAGLAGNAVEVHFNNSRDTIFIDMMNKLEIYIENDIIVNALGLPFEFSQYEGMIFWDTTYSDGLVKLENDMADAFLAHGYEVNPGFYDQIKPDTIHIYGGYSPVGIGLESGYMRMCYSMRFYVSNSAPEGEFCIDNIFYPPDRLWYFMPDIAPDYFDCQNESPENPDCPAVCFPVVHKSYLCGDANSDATAALSDAVWIINFVFVEGHSPYIYESGDCNCDGVVNISDAVWLINYVFVGGNPPCDTDGDGIMDC